MNAATHLVIGSNCFTGAHIVDTLLADPTHRVVGVSRSPEYDPVFLPYKRRTSGAPGARGGFEFHQLDLVRQFDQVAQLLDELRPPVVINVAALSEVALSIQRPVEYFGANTLAVVRLCDHLRRRDYLKRYVHISSAEIFGPCSGAVGEDHLFNPSTPYAVSKAAADSYLYSAIRHQGFPATLIRSTNVYGAHQQLFKIIPRTAIYLKTGRMVELHGGGTAVKNFIHIRDVVYGLMLAVERGQPGVYHFSVNSPDTVADVVRTVCRVMGYPFDRHVKSVGERQGQDSRYWLDCTKAQNELGWRPGVAFEDGVRETVDWINSNWDVIRSKPLEYIHKT